MTKTDDSTQFAAGAPAEIGLEVARTRVETLAARVGALVRDLEVSRAAAATGNRAARRRARRQIERAQATHDLAMQALEALKLEAALVRLALPDPADVELREWETPIAQLPDADTIKKKHGRIQRSLKAANPALF